MFNKKINSLQEDFETLGLIRAKKEVANTISENDLAAQRKAKNAQNGKQKIAKVAESKSVDSTKKELQKLAAIESKIKNESSLKDIMSAFNNISEISKLAIGKFKRLSEQDLADKGHDAATYDGNKGSTDKKEAGKDTLDTNLEKEGNVGYDKDDEQNGSLKSTGEVPTVTDKYAGKPAHKDSDAQDVKIVESDENEDEKDEIETEQDELDINLNQEDEISDQELDIEMDEVPVGDSDIEKELGVEEDELNLDDIDSEMNKDVELDVDDIEPSDEIDMEVGMDSNDVGDIENGVEGGTEDEIEPPMAGMDDEEEEQNAEMESVRVNKADYISELKQIKKEAEDVMAKIRKHAITPQDAESLLKDVVMRLGGAVNDLASMEKYGKSEKETAV